MWEIWDFFRSVFCSFWLRFVGNLPQQETHQTPGVTEPDLTKRKALHLSRLTYAGMTHWAQINLNSQQIRVFSYRRPKVYLHFLISSETTPYISPILSQSCSPREFGISDPELKPLLATKERRRLTEMSVWAKSGSDSPKIGQNLYFWILLFP